MAVGAKSNLNTLMSHAIRNTQIFDQQSNMRVPEIMELDSGHYYDSGPFFRFRTISGNPRQFNYRDESAEGTRM